MWRLTQKSVASYNQQNLLFRTPDIKRESLLMVMWNLSVKHNSQSAPHWDFLWAPYLHSRIPQASYPLHVPAPRTSHLSVKEYSFILFAVCLLVWLECKLPRAGVCVYSAPCYIPSASNRTWQKQVLDGCLLNAEQTSRTKIFSYFAFRKHPTILLTFCFIFYFFRQQPQQQQKTLPF